MLKNKNQKKDPYFKYKQRIPTFHGASYGGRKELVDPETGEKKEVEMINDSQTTDINYVKIWTAHLALALDLVGNAKVTVLGYLLHMVERTGRQDVYKTQEEIAEETNTSRSTVFRTIQELEKGNFIQRPKNGMIRVMFDLASKKSSNQRLAIMYEHKKTENNKVPGQTTLEEHIAQKQQKDYE